MKRLIVNILGYPVTVPIVALDIAANILGFMAKSLHHYIAVPWGEFLIRKLRVEND